MPILVLNAAVYTASGTGTRVEIDKCRNEIKRFEKD